MHVNKENLIGVFVNVLAAMVLFYGACYLIAQYLPISMQQYKPHSYTKEIQMQIDTVDTVTEEYKALKRKGLPDYASERWTDENGILRWREKPDTVINDPVESTR